MEIRSALRQIQLASKQVRQTHPIPVLSAILEKRCGKKVDVFVLDFLGAVYM